jgi:ribosomal protein L29
MADEVQLRELQEATEASLKAAKEEKWTKDGEISTMRRNMAKVLTGLKLKGGL